MENLVLIPRITGSYTDDYNILKIHKIILNNFIYHRTYTLHILRKKLDIERDKLNKQMSVIDLKSIKKNVASLESEIEDITERISEKQYLEASARLVAEYSELGIKKKTIYFGQKSPSVTTENPQDEKRLSIISRYLEIAGRYVEINVVREIKYDNCCPGCSYNIDALSKDMHYDNYEYCPKCNSELTRYIPNSSSEKTTTINTYNDLANFIKEFDRYAGDQKIKIPDVLISDLDQYFASYKLPPSEEIRKLPVRPDGTKEGTDRDMMLRALHETGHVGFYVDVNLICATYWGWKKPTVSHLKTKVIEDYLKTQPIYHSIPKVRRSNLTLQVRLLKHLQLRGHECKSCYFKIVKDESLQEQENIWQQMMVIAAQKYPNDGFVYMPTTI